MSIRSATRLFIAPALLGALGACATPIPQPDFSGLMKPLAECRALYAEVDARVAAAGVGHPAYHRVPGFPYLRTDRLMASYADEVNDLDRFGAWTRRMREFDQEARDYELRNLNLPRQERADLHGRMHACGYGLVPLELQDPAVQARLLQSVRPPDEYSTLRRTVGLLPLTAPLVRHQWADRAATIDARFANAATAPADGAVTIWQPTIEVERRWIPDDLQALPDDPLGFPGLILTAWQALVETHAPQLWWPSASSAPGAPRWHNGQLQIDRSEPIVHYQIGFTRFNGQPLVQIVYFIWSQGPHHPQLMQWRVTLDAQARPLIYDSLHAEDQIPLWFAAQPLLAREDVDVPLLMPQATVPHGRPALRLAGPTHLLVGIAAANAPPANVDRHHYRLRSLDDVFTQETDDGSVNLFLPDGRLRGSDGYAPAWSWPSGTPADGAIRHYLRQPLDPVTRHHYDDPHLLEALFRLPPPATAQLPNRLRADWVR